MTQTASEAPPAPVAVRERGYAAESEATGWWGGLTTEHVPELQWPLNLDVYRRMMTDAQVKSVMRAVVSPLVRTRWSVTQGAAREEVTAFVAGNLGLPVTGAEDETQDHPRGRNRFSWSEHLRWALNMLPYGHMPFEQVYRFDDQGRARLRKLGPRWPKSIAEIKMARDGGLVSIRQHGILGGPGVSWMSGRLSEPVLPVSRLVFYVYEREDDWRGQSILRSAYKNWLLKDHALRTWSISDDRNGVGLPLYVGAEKETDLSAGKKIATQIRSGDNSGAAIPYGAQLGMHGVSGELPDHEKFVRYQDEQIARAALGHFLNLGSQGGGQVGSYALGSVFQNTFHLGVDSVGGDVCGIANPHIVDDLVALNFGPDEPAPRITFAPTGQVPDDGREDPLDTLRRAAGLEDDDKLAGFIRQHVPVTEEVA